MALVFVQPFVQELRWATVATIDMGRKSTLTLTLTLTLTQRDGRPAEHRWRPLFNAANFG